MPTPKLYLFGLGDDDICDSSEVLVELIAAILAVVASVEAAALDPSEMKVKMLSVVRSLIPANLDAIAIKSSLLDFFVVSIYKI